MARITDQKKIERLKQATMKLVVERGFGGASAALIAKEAEVASGYFYMHYKGKYEMVNSILQEVYQEVFEEFELLLQEKLTFWELIGKMVRHFVTIANSEPIKVKFLYVLTNDYSFVIDPHIREKTYEIIRKVKELGHNAGVLDKKLGEEDLFLILFINTIQFINQRYKNSTQKVTISEDDIEHVLYVFKKVLS
ncbi:TetR/AcrR family transcriptional regulator [Prolixibacteraceae bacterium Z1-6]|uniref:TetR/AcrR family transcriptional regulator n=1 Tax=Draconibacterium aestuarii TaxID=2998507 RepID=A0A9X3F656_9BACT|nr:TetR/AcrR family transcriptional regulator [Prolixibacteraceae bacterium Z1-6]